MSLRDTIMYSQQKEDLGAFAMGIVSLKDILEEKYEEIHDMNLIIPFNEIKELGINESQYYRLLQDVSDGLFIDYGWETAMTLHTALVRCGALVQHRSTVGMSTLGLCKPYTILSYACSKHYAGSRNLLPLVRSGNRNLGPGVMLKYSKTQLKMMHHELYALLRRVGELY